MAALRAAESDAYVCFVDQLYSKATRKWPEEGFVRPWPGVIEMSPEIKRRVDELWKQAGLLPTGRKR